MEAFRDCGMASLVMAFLGFVGIVVALASVVVALVSKRAVAPLALGAIAALLGLLALGIAPLAVMQGRAKVEGAASGSMVSPATRQRILEEGYREGQECYVVGGASGTPPLLFALPAIVVGLVRRKRATNP